MHACSPDVFDRANALDSLRGIAGWANDVGLALSHGIVTSPCPVFVEVVRKVVGEGAIPPTVTWARDVLASRSAHQVLSDLERRGAAVGRLLLAALLHKTGSSLFDGGRVVASVAGHISAPEEIRGIDAVLTGERPLRDGDPPLEVLQRVRADLECRKRATGGKPQEFQYLDESGQTHRGVTQGGVSAVLRLQPSKRIAAGHEAPSRKVQGRNTDRRKAVLAVMTAAHVAFVDRSAVLNLAPRFLLHVARYRSDDELSGDPVRAERERCRRQIQMIRDPWVFARVAMIAEQLGLPVDLDP
jgi:hypothetical protein